MDPEEMDPEEMDPDQMDPEEMEPEEMEPDQSTGRHGGAHPVDGTWDVIILGGGPAGENAAQYAIEGSDRTAVIVERELVGGECSYWACMPSKALLGPVELVAGSSHLAGVAATTVDVAATLRRRDGFVSHHDDASQVRWAESTGIDVVRGTGRLTGLRTVEVEDGSGTIRALHARHAVVVATGSSAAIPPVPGLADSLPWTSRDATNLHEVPGRVAVIGGGVVACEAATWLAGLGATVTVLEPGSHLLGRSEPFAGDMVAEQLRLAGVTVRTGTPVDAVSRPDPHHRGEGLIHGGPVTVRAGGSEFEVDEVVVAAGRVPASAGLGLEALGVDLDTGRGFVPVDRHLGVVGVAGEWLYAVGDVCNRAMLTHMGKYQGRIAGAVIAARAEGRPLDGPAYLDVADDGAVPSVVFTDPQVASVGLTESAAREQGIDVETVEYDLASVSGAALLRDDYQGRAKLVIDGHRDLLVGATFAGSGVAELIHSATVAVVAQVPLATLWHVVPSYPTVSEVWLRLLETRVAAARSR